MTIQIFLKIIYSKRKILCIGISICIILGLIILLSSTRTYTSSVTVSPEKCKSKLFFQEKLKIGAKGFPVQIIDQDAIYPYIYPLLFDSQYFYINLLDSVIEWGNNKKTLVRDFIEDNYISQIKIQKFLLNIAGDSGAVMDSCQHNYILSNILKNNISIITNSKSFVSEISVSTNNPYVSAKLSKIVVNQLKAIIRNNRNAKISALKNYITSYSDSLKKEYYLRDKAYSNFLDSHSGSLSSKVKAEISYLKTERDFSYNEYINSKDVLQYIDIKQKEVIPVVCVVTPPHVPNKPTEPKIILGLVGWGLLGTIISLTYIFKYTKYVK